MTIPWNEYPTIAQHPRHEGVRLVDYPNGPAVVNGSHLSTPSYCVRNLAENLEPIEAGELAEWMVVTLWEQRKKARDALLRIWPEGAKCGHKDAREAFEALGS